jgi:hypothetical protein
VYASFLSVALVAASLASQVAADADHVPVPGRFPPAGAGIPLSGELVAVDHVNRRGALRLVGDGDDGRYHSAPSHRFAMLPYGMIRYHGAPAELKDVPLGTVLHGTFLLPPKGDKLVPVPSQSKYSPRHTHALMLEDDFSFYQRQGQAWKIIEAKSGKLKVISEGAKAKNGLIGEQVFEFDDSSRVWKGRQIGELKDLGAGQIVQLNLTWAPDWKNGQFHVADVWIDKESRNIASERQRQIHLRQVRTRWLPGWIDHVEHEPGGKGVVTLTLFGGMDASLYEQARAQRKQGGGAALAAAEWTLRSWWQDHDHKHGQVIDVKDLPNMPPGSSGIQMRVQIRELLEGFRPGRIVRVRPNGFPNVKLPPEERVQDFDDRDR